MKRAKEPVTVERIKAEHQRRRKEISERLGEFADVWRLAGDERIWEEMEEADV